MLEHLGLISLLALALAVALSCFTQLNVGVLCIALAWFIGVYLGDMSVREVASGFPVDIFLTLTGITLIFSQARVNGTLERVAHEAIRLTGGRVGFVPIFYFILGAVIASAGPGNIATIGLLGPIAIATAIRMNISPFLMAIMVGNGVQAGALSPIAPTGAIVGRLMESIGLPGMERETWLYNAAAHALVAFAGYFLFGGLSLLRRAERYKGSEEKIDPLNTSHVITLVVISLLILGVILFGLNVGMAAFAGFVLLTLLRVADQEEAIKKVPWGTIIMVCGVTVLISLMEKTSGMDLFTAFIARFSTAATIIPLLGGTVGLISAYSSTSAVVLPVFLPTVPGLAKELGVMSTSAIAMTMNISGHLVDVSPLSTIGALCVASLPAGYNSRRLFNQLLAWGLSMTVVGAVLCWFLFRVE
ncbi:MAG TPA: SLC13 family permease [Terriglobia bacterium]|nr:SLC13 family permease [Terriglobia bacterium]